MKALLLSCLCLFSILSFSQISTGQRTERTEKEHYMQTQVLHFADFISRFNSGNAASRPVAIEALFDQDDPRRHPSDPASQAYAHLIREFTEDISQRGMRIPAAYPAEAVVRIAVRFRGKADTLLIGLRKEYTADRASYWQVISVGETAFTLISTQKNCEPTRVRADLPPNAHEVSFLPLLRGIAEYSSLCPFTHCATCPDSHWMSVENALRTGELTVSVVTGVTLYLNAGDRWRMEIREFIREKDNSGWLISNILPL